MKNGVKKIGQLLLNNNCYIGVFIFYLFTLLFDTSMYVIQYPLLDGLLKIFRYLTYLFFTMRIAFYILYNRKKLLELLKNNWMKRKMFIIAISLFMISSLVNFLLTKNTRLITILIVVVASVGVNFKEIIKSTLFVQIIGLIFLFFSVKCGVIDNFINYRGDGTIRNSFGFTYPTCFSQIIMFSTLFYGYIRKQKITWCELIILSAINIITYLFTDSRTEILFSIMIIVVFSINKLGYINGSICDKVGLTFENVFPLFPIGSFILSYCYQYRGIFEILNKLSSNRLAQTYINIKAYHIPIFGKRIDFITRGAADVTKYGTKLESNFIDNEYMYILFNEGLLILVFITYFILLTIHYLKKHHKYWELYLLLMTMLFSLLNPRILNLLYTPVCFLVFESVGNVLNEIKN